MFLLRVANRKESGVSRGGKNVNLNTHQLRLEGEQRIICRLKSNCNRVFCNMKQSPESKYCSKPGIVSRMRSINCPDAGLYFMVTSTEFKLWRVLGPTQNFRGDGTEQRQHLVYITNIVPNKEANIETWKTWCLWSFAWILLPGQTRSFFEF